MGAACGATCGITRERERHKDAARALVLRTFPLGLAPVPAWTPDEPPFRDDELDALADTLKDVLPCKARVLRSTSVERADWIYLVASLGGGGSWFDLREDGGEQPEDVARTETCVRVGLSPLGRFATLQEVRLTGARDVGGWWVEERRLAGIEDRRLQLFVKASQGLLRRQKVVALDAAFLAEPVDDPSGYGLATTGAAPTLWTVLFDRDPAVTSVGTFLPG